MNKALILGATLAISAPSLAADQQAGIDPPPRPKNSSAVPVTPPAKTAATPAPPLGTAPQQEAASEPIVVTAVRPPRGGGGFGFSVPPPPPPPMAFAPGRDPLLRACNIFVLHDEGFLGAAGSERVLDVDAGPYVMATIEGKPVRLRVDLDAPAYFIRLNPAAAKRVHMTGCIDSYRTRSGQRFETMRGQGVVTIGDKTVRRHVYWSKDKDYTDADADGIIGVQALPERQITFQMHAPVAGEHRIVLPFEDDGGYIFNQIKPGIRLVAVFYAPQRRQSIATAAGAAYLATLSDGRWSGPSTTIQVPVWFEVPRERPAREMTLGKPFSLSGLPVRGFMVRTADFRGLYKLPASGEPARPEKYQLGDNAWLQVTLGQDSLGGCSSISVDKKSRTLTLSCV